MREKCSRCGKRKNIRFGTWTSWGGLYPGGRFFCNRCLNQMEKEEMQKKLEPIVRIAKNQIIVPYQSEANKMRMLREILLRKTRESGWVKLMDITQAYETKLNMGSVDVRHVSRLLNKMGLTKRARKKRGSYTYVFIDKEFLEHKTYLEPNI